MEAARLVSYYSFRFRRLLKCKQALSFSDHLTVNVAPKYAQQESFENKGSMFSFPDLKMEVNIKRLSNAFV
jgi:hypothetical protein